MKRAPTDKPNLDDVLARDFSQLKVGEENLKPETTPVKPVKKKDTVVMPKAYNQRIDAVEDRDAFVVKPPASPSDKAKPNQGDAPERPILKSPSFQPGDDFDVDW